jgi:hypothetical protein
MAGIVRIWTQPRVGGGAHYLAGEIYAANVSRLLDVRGGRAAMDFLCGLPGGVLEHVTRGSGAARHPVLVVRDAGELIAAALAAGVTVMDERGGI